MGHLPKVLLLGDSIRMSYQPVVKELLAGVAEVVGPAENCQYSAFTLSHLDDWLRTLGRPHVIHWNNGLHDCGYNPNRKPIQYPVSTYVDNLRAVLAKLRATGAPVIWATTTPVHPRRRLNPTVWSWKPADIDRYNAAAAEVMEREGIPINDLHALIATDFDRNLGEDMLHLSEIGVRKCAQAVVAAIRPYLPGPGAAPAAGR